MTSQGPVPGSGARVLGFGKNADNAAQIQARLREAGYRATNFALTDDPDGDERLVSELRNERFDVVAIGGVINGQIPSSPPTEGSMLWFERVLNLITEHSPGTKVALVRGPDDALDAIRRVVG